MSKSGKVRDANWSNEQSFNKQELTDEETKRSTMKARNKSSVLARQKISKACMYSADL